MGDIANARLVNMSGRYPLSPYFGDYPNGRYISAFAPPGAPSPDDDDFEAAGVIRFRMPEEEVNFPLWDDNGLLPDDPELLESGLGLSAALVADLKTWGAEWNDRRSQACPDFTVRRERLREKADVLIDRMRRELHEGLQVVLDLR